jgi:hypothetical protein
VADGDSIERRMLHEWATRARAREIFEARVHKAALNMIQRGTRMGEDIWREEWYARNGVHTMTLETLEANRKMQERDSVDKELTPEQREDAKAALRLIDAAIERKRGNT